jgi:hypothetical protein
MVIRSSSTRHGASVSLANVLSVIPKGGNDMRSQGLDVFKYGSEGVGSAQYLRMFDKLTRLASVGYKIKTYNGFVFGQHNFADVLSKIREVTVYSKTKEVVVTWF